MTNIENLENKYNNLKEEFSLLVKQNEEERSKKENQKRFFNEEMKGLETKIKSLFLEEREVKITFFKKFRTIKGSLKKISKNSKHN